MGYKVGCSIGGEKHPGLFDWLVAVVALGFNRVKYHRL
jgi:hypothetical protein